MAGAPAHINTRLTTGPDVGFTDLVCLAPGDITATYGATIPVLESDWYVHEIHIAVGATIAHHALNYYTFDAVYRNSEAGGNVSLFSSPPSTQSASMNGISAYRAEGLGVDQNQACGKGGTILVTATLNGSLTLSNPSIVVRYRRQL